MLLLRKSFAELLILRNYFHWKINSKKMVVIKDLLMSNHSQNNLVQDKVSFWIWIGKSLEITQVSETWTINLHAHTHTHIYIYTLLSHSPYCSLNISFGTEMEGVKRMVFLLRESFSLHQLPDINWMEVLKAD